MAVQTSAGSTISIGSGVPTTYNSTGFAALTYTEISEVTDIGEFGKEFNTVTHTPVGDRKVQKFKGSYNNGSIQLQMGKDADSTGQTALQAALESDNSYAFLVTLQDLTKLYFTGKVMSYKNSVGSVDQITGASCTIELDGDVVEV